MTRASRTRELHPGRAVTVRFRARRTLSLSPPHHPCHRLVRFRARRTLSLSLSHHPCHRLAPPRSVNVRFDKVDGMEYSEDLLIFDLMHVRLLHGWCVDPQDKTTARVVGHLTYNQLVEKVIELSSPARPGPPATAAHPRAAPTARPAADGLDDEELQAALKLSMQPRTPPPSPPPSPPFSRRRPGSNATPAPAAAAPADAAAAPASVAPSPPPSPPASSPSAVASTTDALIAQEWLQTSANQLTYHGLEKLHCGCNHELAIISMQSSACTHSLQSSACNHQHAIISMQSSACNHQHAATSLQPRARELAAFFRTHP